MHHSSKFVSFNHTKYHFTRKLAVFDTILGSSLARWLQRQVSNLQPPGYEHSPVCIVSYFFVQYLSVSCEFYSVLQTFRHLSFRIVTHRFASLVPSMSPQNLEGTAGTLGTYPRLYFIILSPRFAR